MHLQFDGRIEKIEQKLNGVYNLNGKLIALEHICKELGVPIPDVDVSG